MLAQFRLAPWVCGALCIGGLGLARGYLTAGFDAENSSQIHLQKRRIRLYARVISSSTADGTLNVSAALDNHVNIPLSNELVDRSALS